jgi:hypothetical protein
MHAYERDLHLILTSGSWSRCSSSPMETAPKPNLRPSTSSRKMGGCDGDCDDIERGQSRAGIISRNAINDR